MIELTLRSVVCPAQSSTCSDAQHTPPCSAPLLQGYTTRDRRRAHVIAADEAAEAVLAASAGTPHAGDLATASADGTLVKDAAPISGLFKQDTEFSMLLQAGRLLLELGRLAEAKTLMESSIRLFAK